jgi:hypothetical protein
MSDYFCPGCDKLYSYRQLDDMRPEEKVTVEEIRGHFLCSCGYEGCLWPTTEQGRLDYIKYLENMIRFDDDMIQAEQQYPPSTDYWKKDRDILMAKLKKLTGQDVKEEKKKADTISAFKKWMGG